jgi:SAM-dependent methyltransferase
MEDSAIRQMHAVETRHWWFTARRSIVARVIRDLGMPRPARILEAGCGTGGNLAMLAGFGEVSAFEPHPYCLEHARSIAGADVRPGRLPDDVPFSGAAFDLVAALDVVEHIADDRSGLVALRDRVKPGGHILLTVPAYSFLWSEHDDRHHHYRRYTRASLVALASEAGLRDIRCSYFNTLLFPAVAAVRTVKNWAGRRGSTDDALPPPSINSILAAVFAAESHLLGSLDLPFGTSLLLTAKNSG